MLCVAVDIGNNFEAWKRSSIRNPFGFERSEVLAGLGMSVGLLFMGLDLISHGLTHALENVGSHVPHHSHSHAHPSITSINISAFLAIAATLVSAMVLKNHQRIGKVMQIGYISWLPSILNNPSHLMTLSCCFLLIPLSLVSGGHLYTLLDRVFSMTLSLAMIALGWHQGWTLGKMLMMSYSGPDVSSVLNELYSDPAVTGIDEAKFWQVHYGLCQANLKLRVRSLDDMVRLRDRVSSLVRNRLGGGYGTGGAGQKWEVSTQISLDGHRAH
jgi:divalent metal cation (Fe/Co/Zn/Cd) transporter